MDFIFPKDFVWGAGSSAYQIEDARFEGGKVADVYDHYSVLMPEKYSFTGPAGSADFYHHFREDIKLMGEQGLKSFRFSFSWARIQSEIGGPVNQAGIDYYNQVIDCLIENSLFVIGKLGCHVAGDGPSAQQRSACETFRFLRGRCARSSRLIGLLSASCQK